MPDGRTSRLTILRAMVLVAIAGLILGLFGNFRDMPDFIAALLVAAMVIVVPLHLAIEGNRREDAER